LGLGSGVSGFSKTIQVDSQSILGSCLRLNEFPIFFQSILPVIGDDIFDQPFATFG
jgi:hypothetical protein